MSNDMTTRHNGMTMYYPNNGYDANWYCDQTAYCQCNGQQYQQPSKHHKSPQLALTAPQHTTAQEQQAPAIHLVLALDNKM